MEHLYFNSVQEFNDHYGFETFHPLVSVVRFDRQEPFEECMVHYGVYALFLKENKGCKMFYGRTEYDFDEMTITSFEPGKYFTFSRICMVEYKSFQSGQQSSFTQICSSALTSDAT